MSASAENVASPKVEMPKPEPPKERRGPGRPRNDGTPPGSKRAPEFKSTAAPNKRKGKINFDDAAKEALAKQVHAIHQVAALTTGIPELNLAPEESRGLAASIASVCEEYDLSLDGKTGAAIQLMAACAMIYVPRYFAMTARVKRQNEERDANAINGSGITGPHADATAH